MKKFQSKWQHGLILALCLSFGSVGSAWAWGDPPPANAEDKLKGILGPQIYTRLVKYRQNWQEVKTQSLWLQNLQTARKLSPDLSAPLSQLHEKAWNNPKAKQLDFTWVEPLIPGMKVRLVAEGTVLSMALYYPDFAKLAQKTPETGDDQLIQLMLKAYGDYATNWPLWFYRTWDYGGCTKLGSGLHLKIWNDVQALKAKYPTFEPDLAALRQDLERDLINAQSFCLPQSKVLGEFKQILQAPGQSPSERQRLQNRLKSLQSGKNLEFNCLSEMGKCHFGA